MKKKDRLRFKKLLLQERERLVNNANSLLKHSMNNTAEKSSDEADLASIELSSGMDFELRAKERQTIIEIDYALEKIETGEYGFCEECGESILGKRLSIFPTARFCIQHQEELERKKKIFAA